MSSRIPKSFIDDVLARTDIVALIDARIPLRHIGANFAACCPFHQEKTPSFTVSPTKQFYHCFGCGVSGNAISFLMEYERLEFVPTIELLASQLGMTIPQTANSANTPSYQALYQLMDKISNLYQQQLRQTPHAIDYLKKRGVSGQIAKEFGIGFASSQWDQIIKQFGQTPEQLQDLIAAGMAIQKDNNTYYDRFRDRLMFPIRDRRGYVIGFGGRTLGDGQPKYLNSPETAIFHKGRELYGLYEARRANRELSHLLIVEGYMDLIALAQHGIHNVVATLGTATTDEHLKQLFRHCQELTFCFDGDKAGYAAAWRALTIALPLLEDGMQINFMFLPEGEDPDSTIRAEGTERFQARIAAATPLSDFFFSHLSSELNLNSIEGKARLAKPASDLLSKMPNSVFRHRMFDRLAEIVRVETPQLLNLAGIKPTYQKPTTNITKTQKKNTRQRPTPVRFAIALLVQYPELIQYVDNYQFLNGLQLPGVALLIQLLDQMKHYPKITTTGTLLEHWRDKPEENKLLAKLAAWEHHLPPSGLKPELEGALQCLRLLAQEQQIEHLLAKANQTGLTKEEKQLLQQLITISKTNEVNKG